MIRELLSDFGVTLMMISFPPIGATIIFFAAKIKYKYRARTAMILGILIFSRGATIWLTKFGLDDTWPNTIMEDVAGVSSLLFWIYLGPALKEFKAGVDIQETKKSIDKLTEIGEKIINKP
jgi:hypothetical protein